MLFRSVGIVHQVNLEFLAKCVFLRQDKLGPVAIPDTLVGTDSHTTMINGLGVVGWGVGGIEAEAALLGQPMVLELDKQVVATEDVLQSSSGAFGFVVVVAQQRLLTIARGTVPLALFGLGVFNLSARAAQLPELTPAFLANNLFIFFCAILVIFMNAGFAMVEAGLCRQKNAVNILAKNLIVFALVATAYWFIGYKIMYNASWVIPGWFKFGGLFFDPTVTPEMVTEGKLVPSVDFLFQLAFAGTAATIVSGLVAERIKFGEFIIFSLLLTGILYPISGSWQWNVGEGWLNKLGFIDFAGSTVVHSFGAWAGLVGAMLLGPRIGKFVDGKPQAIPGHNQAIATLGCLILWLGW